MFPHLLPFEGDVTLAASGAATVVEANVDHNALANVTSGDAHTQYALLAGRGGSQALTGGTAANEDLTLEGTAHATKTTSYVLLQPSGGNVGIGTTSPLAVLEVAGDFMTPYGGLGAYQNFLLNSETFPVAPAYLCNPVEKQIAGTVTPIVDPAIHLACYRMDPLDVFIGFTAADQFGQWILIDLTSEVFCVPSLKEDPTQTEDSSWGKLKSIYR